MKSPIRKGDKLVMSAASEVKVTGRLLTCPDERRGKWT
ncbi:hypothetical protein R69927_00962 [Paraburkholderia domus]|uniref:Uncharacterized protein n=1 Tax=Paraburkholderia domus TaxID=2793075 RepID=A0A9N8QX21_9BURK|nr:hypothetical protein R75483_04033 [Paraburkholderia domus]CAE6827611.1 hypothetical protein R69927_00962 [Paraburkholderia domus]CAE6855136.1 hypothetical protein R70199_00541 [Paraburkholderia domus]CAE6867070.1 hypothetical protein R70211_00887 [Paraburkholderia domus]